MNFEDVKVGDVVAAVQDGYGGVISYTKLTVTKKGAASLQTSDGKTWTKRLVLRGDADRWRPMRLWEWDEERAKRIEKKRAASWAKGELQDFRVPEWMSDDETINLAEMVKDFVRARKPPQQSSPAHQGQRGEEEGRE